MTTREKWLSIREEQRQEQIAALTLERDHYRQLAEELAQKLLGATLPVDVRFVVNDQELALLIGDNERTAEAMNLEQATITARSLVPALVRGNWQMAGEILKSWVKNHLASKRAKRGADLVRCSLAEAAPEIPLRVLNALESCGIETAGHLLAIGPRLDELAVPNVGLVAITQLKLTAQRLAGLAGEALLPAIPKRAPFASPESGQEPGASDPGSGGRGQGSGEGDSPLRAELLAEEFNHQFPVGARVVFRGQLKTTVQGEAFVQHGRAVCTLAKVRGSVPVGDVTAAEARQEAVA